MAAVAVGMIPGLAAWTALIAKTGLRSVGYGTTEGLVLTPALIESANQNNLFIDGAFALEQGFIYSAMILAAMTAYIIDRDFVRAAMWSLSAAALCFLGLMHSWQFTPGDTVVNLPLLDVFIAAGEEAKSFTELVPAWEFALAYTLVAAILIASKWLTRPANEP